MLSECRQAMQSQDILEEKKLRGIENMKTRIALAVMALALVCLSMTPALATPLDSNNKDRCNASMQRGGLDGPHNWMLLVDDATRENFDNMTLNQIKLLQEEKTAQLNNMTMALIREMKKDHMGRMGPGVMGDGMMDHAMMKMNDQGPMGQGENCQGMGSGQAGNGRESACRQRGGR
jgi:hypothetical protein